MARPPAADDQTVSHPDTPDEPTSPEVGENAEPTEAAEETGPAEVREKAETVGTAGEDAPGRATDRQRRLALVLTVVLVGLVAAAVTGGGLLSRSQAVERDGAEAVAAARQVAVKLTSMKAPTADVDLQRLIDSSTGEFRAEFADRQQPFVEIVRKAQVDTSGEVVAAGLDSAQGDTAHILVAVRSTVRNAAAQEGEARDYRLGITVQRIDGRWLASKVDFVA